MQAGPAIGDELTITGSEQFCGPRQPAIAQAKTPKAISRFRDIGVVSFAIKRLDDPFLVFLHEPQGKQNPASGEQAQVENGKVVWRPCFEENCSASDCKRRGADLAKACSPSPSLNVR